MNIKKRLLLIIVLIMVTISLFIITRRYEKNFISRKEADVIKNYSVFEKVKNYKKENLERYIKYQENNKDLSNNQIVTRVNIGLDNPYYTNIKKADINKGILILTNKYLKLDKDYIPNDLEKIDNKYFINGNKNANLLRKEAKEAFEELSKASIENNTPVYGQSGYRSYKKQELLYMNSIKEIGKDKTDLETARPGHSEHQTGLTIDVSSTKSGNMLDFEQTNSYLWMKDNSYKYGFILRYPKGKEKIQGFIYESWHYRYVGKDISKDMHDNYSNLTFDEYYYMFIEKKGQKS